MTVVLNFIQKFQQLRQTFRRRIASDLLEMEMPTSVVCERTRCGHGYGQRIVSAEVNIHVMTRIFPTDSWYRRWSTRYREIVIGASAITGWLSEWEVEKVDSQLANISSRPHDLHIASRASWKGCWISGIDKVGVVELRLTSTCLRNWKLFSAYETFELAHLYSYGCNTTLAWCLLRCKL